MSLLEHSSFEELISQQDVQPLRFNRTLDAMEGVEILEVISQLGDRVLKLVRQGVMETTQGEAFLLQLVNAFRDPLAQAPGVAQIRKDLKEYQR